MSVLLLQGNALEIPIADKSVHCVVTSPPFYGLRKYEGMQSFIWGGDENCQHEWKDAKGGLLHENRNFRVGSQDEVFGPLVNVRSDAIVTSGYCSKCDAFLGSLGLEPTLDQYVKNTVLWAREVWRVLRDDGVFFLNIGDSYFGGKGKSGYELPHEAEIRRAKGETLQRSHQVPGYMEARPTDLPQEGFKPKDLMLVPHRVAIALQNDGWWVRSDIVWEKPNPMPESVRDRPTKSHEYIFLLTKRKNYYYDQDAIREAQKPESFERANRAVSDSHKNLSETAVPPGSKIHSMHKKRSHGEGFELNPAGRNKRSVWTITTKPYKGAHFATFPPEIPETCIKAGTSERGVCPVCGSQWATVVESEKDNRDFSREQDLRQSSANSHRTIDGVVPSFVPPKNTTIGWKPTCSHNEEPIPATILDPFCGSATAIMVARQLGRNGIGIDLSWEYLQLARERTGEKAWKEWIEGKKSPDLEGTLEKLPLFKVQNK